MHWILNKANAQDLLLKAWKEVLLYDPTMNKQTKEKTLQYANVNFWRGIAKERSYNYHHKKLYRLMEGNTCAIQAQVKDMMLFTLDGNNYNSPLKPIHRNLSLRQ